jgi:hypothetical protein
MESVDLVVCDFEERRHWDVERLFNISPSSVGQPERQRLVWCTMYSIPTKAMSETQLTKDKVAALLTSMCASIPRPVTHADWRVTITLHGSAKVLKAAVFHRPVQHWELIESREERLRHASP